MIKAAADRHITRAMPFRSELFDMANKFAIAGQGHIATALHEACNQIARAKHRYEGGEATPETNKEDIEVYVRNNP